LIGTTTAFARSNLIRHPDAGILDPNLRVTAGAGIRDRLRGGPLQLNDDGAYANLAPVGHRVTGVYDQVYDHLLKLPWVDHHGRHWRFGGDLEPD
jgi:hypothetical protein